MAIEPTGFPLNMGRSLIRPLFRSLAIPASGLSAQRSRLDVIAQNIANAETTRTEQGGPYRRKVLGMAPQAAPTAQPGMLEAGRLWPAGARAGQLPLPTASNGEGGVQVTAIQEDANEGPLVYDPGHPDANESGYVRYPNVQIMTEMVDLMDARRAYEANATVFQAMKSMLQRATEI